MTSPQAFETLTIESDLKNLSRVRAFVRAFLSGLPDRPLTQERIDSMELAASELTANIVRHAYREQPGRTISIEARHGSNRIEFRFHDQGAPWDPDAVPPPAFDGTQTGGFGLYIISQAVDQVNYCRDADGTNIACLAISLQEEKMQFELEKHPDAVVVHILTEVIDAKNAGALRNGLKDVIEENSHVIFDMGQVDFLDSSGCGAILSCLRRLNQKGGSLKLFGLKPKVRTLIELIRMHRIVDIFDSQQEALQAP